MPLPDPHIYPINLLAAPDSGATLTVEIDDDGVPVALNCGNGTRFPIIDGVARFVPSDSYANAFGRQWNRFPRTQFDSVTGLPISRKRLERLFGDNIATVRGKVVLEAGCGSGRFTEILLSEGAAVIALDMSSAVEACRRNFAHTERLAVAQADILAAPIAPASMEVVVCVGVVQHTPNPEKTIRRLASYVAPGGILVIDHYRDHWKQKYHLPRRAARRVMLALPDAYASAVTFAMARTILSFHRLFWHRNRWCTRALRIIKPASPVTDHYLSFPELPRDTIYEWSVLDTHDALTDRYKHLRTPEQIAAALEEAGLHVERCEIGGNGVEAIGRKPPSVCP